MAGAQAHRSHDKQLAVTSAFADLASNRTRNRQNERARKTAGTRNGGDMIDRATEFDYGAARLIDTHERILRAEAAASRARPKQGWNDCHCQSLAT